MRTLRVGIIGFGFIGKVHAYAHRTIPFYYDPPPLRTELHAVATARPETAARAREAFGFRLATTDWHEVAENPSVDIVHIATPNHLHREQVLAALRAGKHVYCEKPLAASAAQAREIAAAAREAAPAGGIVTQMTLQNRFFPATLRARALVEEGLLGDVLGFRGAYLHAGSADPKAPLRWKLSQERAGGGVLYDLGPHILDLLELLAGPFVSVSAATRIAFAERPSAEDPTRRVPVDAEDSAVLLLRAAGGAIGTAEVSKIATGAQDELRFEIHGTRGALRFNLMEPNHLDVYDLRDPGGAFGGSRGWKRIDTVANYPAPAGFPGPKFSVGWIRGHVACLENFLRAIAEGRPASPDIAAGAHLQEIMDAAYRSAGTGRWEDIPGARER
ncbi:MAG: Gfo/Idh/MocA family oxidoreductase [Planctomycetes bacterium]|nr:Gfo/Idh/MocA family oxidoreductase [Planctomycetota bacterium]